MIILGFLIIGSLAVVLIGNIHSILGAVILGLDTAGTDYFLLWLRFKFTRPNKPKYLALTILGGLVARVIFLFVFLKIGSWWFGINGTEFYIFIACVLTIPVWNLIAAYQYRSERG
jgi:hypothetical protein